MIPAKNRDRKCSTCRHYQPSPLWRKGWCRNPLLYDRNTNHLVEADSLACNRTFIDYWEPVTGPTNAVGPQARTGKPRIAPSIPMSTTDPRGQRSVVTGNTPVGGMAALSDGERDAAPGRDGRHLSLVTPDYEPGSEEEEQSRVTRQIEQVPGPGKKQKRPESAAPTSQAASAATNAAVPASAAERIKKARSQRRAMFLASTRGRLLILLAAIFLLGALAGGAALMLRNRPVPVAAAVPTSLPTAPLPTPTGLGDATATPVNTPTTAAPPAGQIGVNGWVQVQAAGGLTLRATPGKSGARLRLLNNGIKAHVVEGPKDADGLTWWRVDRFDPAKPDATGWCAGQFLVPTAAP